MSTISQTTVPVYGRELQITTACPPGLDLCVTIERLLDGFYYDPSDQTFKDLGSITTPYVMMTENPPASGTYVLNVDVTSFNDGNYKTRLYDCTADPANPTLLDDDGNEIFIDGGTGAPTSSIVTRIDENYPTPDALCYVDSSGVGIEGASIYVFDSATYDADAPTLTAIAVSETDDKGAWKTPVFLDPGSYVILFVKPNAYGPDTVNITVI